MMAARTKYQQLTRWKKRLFVAMLPLAILVSLLPVTGQQASAQLAVGDLALILLDGTTPYTAAVRQLKAASVCIRHVFPPNVLIGQMPSNLTPEVLASAGVTAVYREAVNSDQLAAHGPSAQKASRAWNDMLAALSPQSDANQITVAQAGADLVGDALTPPDLPDGEAMTATSAGDEPSYYQTSEFMIGSVAVGIILPESDGSNDPSTEDWTQEEREQVYSEIVAATNWWAVQEPAANLTFVYDDHFSQPVPTSYEPISRPQSDQGLWIGEVMDSLGYGSATSYFTRVRNYVNDLRVTYQTDWAFAIFVVDSSNDVDNYFATGYFAYAYLGGPFTVMTYGNNGYGIRNMDAVAAHEMGHIFLALDQYSAARVPCTTRAGYLDVETQNSLYGTCASNESSIMRGHVRPYTNGDIDYYAKGQVGWWDSDGDGVLDPVDTSTEVILTQETQPPEAGQTIRYAGSIRDIPFPSTRRRSTTINRITGMAYRLDGGEWQQISPFEGEFDSIEEAFAFDLPPLAEGIYQLDLLVHTSPGGDRIVSAASVVVVPAPGSTALQELHDFTPNPTTDNTPTYSGIAAVMDGIVATVEFRIDGGDWQPAEASDGHFDAVVETFVFTTFVLAPGLHIIEVRTTDSAGKVADPCCGDTLEILETHTVYLPSVVHNQ